MRSSREDAAIHPPLENAILMLRRGWRVGVLMTVTLTLMSIVAAAMALVALATGFRARRFYAEVMARWLGRAILRLWRVRVVVHQERPFPDTQTIYISNHTSTVDMFVLISLGLPRARFFLWGGTRKWLPLTVIGYLIGTFYTPPQTNRTDRVRCFERADRILRRTGDSVYLSPEGVRVTTGRIGPFNKGAFHLATSLGAPLVPLYILIPREINPGTGFAALPGSVHVYVKPAIPTQGWRLGDLERNKEMVRELYVGFQRELEGAAHDDVRLPLAG